MEPYILAPVLVAACLSVLAAYALIGSIKYRRSFFSSVVELYLRLTTPRLPYPLIMKRLKKQAALPIKRLRLRTGERHGVRTDEYEHEGRQVFVFTPSTSGSGEAILYLYGGGYVRLPRRSHIRFVKRLARRTGVRVIFPIYPRAPHDTAEDARAFVLSLYGTLSCRLEKIALCGDSSGGGLALILANALAEAEYTPMPRALVLLSPFLDISLSGGRHKEYERRDPLIYISNTLAGATLFAGGEDMKSPLVSPYFARVPHHEGFFIFTGDRELLYPQISAFSKRLTDEGVPHTLTVGRGMNHVYQIYPIKEASAELCRLAEIISGALTGAAEKR